MKLKIQSLFLIMVLGTVIMSCGDDDDAPRANAYEFDGTMKDIKAAYFDDNSYYNDEGAFDFWFGPEEYTQSSDWHEYVGIQVPRELMGTKFELTEERPYPWAWEIEFYQKRDNGEIWYGGYGDEGAMEDVQSGTVKAVNKGDNNFELEADIVFTDGKTLKLYYSGKILPWNEEDNGRKPTSLSKKVSPNTK